MDCVYFFKGIHLKKPLMLCRSSDDLIIIMPYRIYSSYISSVILYPTQNFLLITTFHPILFCACAACFSLFHTLDRFSKAITKANCSYP